MPYRVGRFALPTGIRFLFQMLVPHRYSLSVSDAAPPPHIYIYMYMYIYIYIYIVLGWTF